MSAENKVVLFVVIPVAIIIAFALGIRLGGYLEGGFWMKKAENGEVIRRDYKYYAVKECEAIYTKDDKWYPAKYKKIDK
jgi:hypothetical protein